MKFKAAVLICIRGYFSITGRFDTSEVGFDC